MAGEAVYDRDPLVHCLRYHFEATPLIPIREELDLYKVLRKTSGGFRILGNLADVCQDGDKKTELAKIFNKQKSRYFPKSKRMGSYRRIYTIDTNAFANASVAGIGVKAGLGEYTGLEISVPYYKEKKVDQQGWNELLEGWKPNLVHIDAREVELWVVQRVVKVRSLKAKGLEKKTGVERVSGATSETMQDINFAAEWKSSKYGAVELDSGSRFRFLPIAFSGYIYKFDRNGEQLDCRPTSDPAERSKTCCCGCFALG